MATDKLDKSFTVSHLKTVEGITYVLLSGESKAFLEQLIADKERAAEVALARKVLAVSGGLHKIRGFTQAKRLKLLTDKMNEIIPDDFGIIEEATLNNKQEEKI